MAPPQPGPSPAADPATSTAGEAAPIDSAAEPQPEDVPLDGAGADVDDLMAEDPMAASQAEVVVTVDRRQKNLQDYSGTASAFSERTLMSVGVTNVRDLAVMVPGLQIAQQESGTAIFIRGVGSDNFTELGDPAVALHVDGVYMPRPRGLGNIFYDIARVEVNSGPQGTLRGRNAVGGAVNIVTNQPKLGEFESSAQAAFGSYSLRNYQGMVNIPLGDTLAIRVAGASVVHDSYWVNGGPLYDIPGAQNQNDWSIRAQAKWQPVKPLVITAAYDRIEEHGTGYLGAQFMQAINGINQLIADPNDYDTIGNPRSVYQRGWNPSVDMWHQGVRGNVSFDTGPVILEALASYRWQDYKQVNTFPARVVLDDSAYFPGIQLPTIDPDVYSGNLWHNTSKATILELRASAPDTARLRWSLGGFYFNEDQGAFLGQTRDPAGGYGGGEFNMPSTIGRSFAGYGDATFDITEDFRALAGLRVTHDYKERKGGIWAVWTGGGSPATTAITGINNLGRFGTEGFQYAGFDRPDYSVPPAGNRTERVNWFLDGIKSFGARDQIAIQLCNDPPAAVDGAPQAQRLVLNEEGRFRCANGVRETVPENIFNVVQQDFDVTSNYVDWRAGLEYDIAKENLVYATVTTGHKAAGFNDTLFQGDETFNSDYGPEKLISYELGTKNEFLDRRLKLNAAAFFFTYSGMQFQTIVAVGDPPPRNPDGTIQTDPATGMPFQDNRSGSAVRQNAQEQTNVYGLDLDLIYALPAGLEAELHALLMDARFSDGTYVQDTRLDPGPRNAQVDLGGNWLPRTAPYTLNYNLSQLIFTDVGAFDWIVQGQTVGESFQTVFNGNGKRLVKKGPNWAPEMDTDPTYVRTLADPSRLTDVVPVHTTINIGAGWKHPDGRLSIRGSISNLFDVTYATFIASSNGGNLRFYNNQRLGSITVRVDW